MGGVTINVQVPVSRRSLPVDRRQPPAGLHPERHPAHERRRGAPLRALAPRLERLRPRRCASSACCCRCASRPIRRTSSRACRSWSRPSSQHGQDGHPGRPARAAARTRLGGRHQEHPLVRLRAAVLPEGARASSPRGYVIAAVRSARSGPRSRTPSRPIRPTRRSARNWPRRPPSCGSSTARATRARGTRHRRLPRLPRHRRPRRRARSHRARSRRTRRSSSTTARSDRLPDTIAYLEKTFGVTVTEKTDPAIRTDIIVTVGHADAAARGAARTLTPRGSDPAVAGAPYSIGVSQWAYSGRRPRTASK